MSEGCEIPLQQPPTKAGASFTISELGTTEGGTAISAISDAFEDSWEEKALVVTNEDGKEQTYSFQGRSPIYCCHVPQESHVPEEHGPQTVGFRYHYRFIREIDADNEIRVVNWENTRFTDVEEVWYP